MGDGTMKIQIEFENSYHAKLIIDGVEMTIETKPGFTQLKGIKGDSLDGTLGGIAASEMYYLVSRIQQAWSAATEIDTDARTWSMLCDEAAGEASERIA